MRRNPCFYVTINLTAAGVRIKRFPLRAQCIRYLPDEGGWAQDEAMLFVNRAQAHRSVGYVKQYPHKATGVRWSIHAPDSTLLATVDFDFA